MGATPVIGRLWRRVVFPIASCMVVAIISVSDAEEVPKGIELCGGAVDAYRNWEIDRAIQVSREGIELARLAGDSGAEAWCQYAEILASHARHERTDLQVHEGMLGVFALFERAGDLEGQGLTLIRLYESDDSLEPGTEESTAVLAEAQRLLTTAGSEIGQGHIAIKQGQSALEAEELEAAERAFREALTRYERAGYERGLIHVLGELGELALSRGDLEAADETFRRSLERSHRLGYPHGEIVAHDFLARIAGEREDLEGRRLHLEQGLALCMDVQLSRHFCFLSHHLGKLQEEEGLHGKARKTYGDALALAPDDFWKAFLTLDLALLAEDLDEHEVARERFAEILELESTDSQYPAAIAARRLADAARDRGDRRAAAEFYRLASEFAARCELPGREAPALEFLAEIQRELGSTAEADTSHRLAAVRYADAGKPKKSGDVWSRQAEIERERGDRDSAHSSLQAAVDAYDAANEAGLSARRQSERGDLWDESGDLVAARDAYGLSLVRAIEAGDESLHLFALQDLFRIARLAGDEAEAAKICERIARLGKSGNEAHTQAYTLRGRGQLAQDLGDWPAARALFEQASVAFLDAGLSWSAGDIWLTIARAEFRRQAFVESEAAARRALEVFEGNGDAYDRTYSLLLVAAALYGRGQTEEGRAHAESAAGELTSAGRAGTFNDTRRMESAASALLDIAPPEVLGPLLDAIEAVPASGPGADCLRGAGLEIQATIAWARGDFADSWQALMDAQASYERAGAWVDAMTCLSKLARVAGQLGEFGLAEELALQRGARYAEKGRPEDEGWAWMDVANARADQGRTDDALAALDRAAELLELADGGWGGDRSPLATRGAARVETRYRGRDSIVHGSARSCGEARGRRASRESRDRTGQRLRGPR